ncbi:hypothetical protein ABZ816_34575 [Actinosynnema sp. NPDC047251]|uniref:Tetratricopeptide repeat protein n=1 Tax=Saccharothrix espanaensis (strain ATCC 51144 / DSM 44229 / JCM 9112 / NBRC 15066 / NRRL 15764) TaxID=1179773 RepID=K0K5N8_SACES|nr:hypothetical protein [Saccharothrix espanaensis]CCH32174.1 hypothetical protein BN6_49030 [Saccharothrix espanaensis DSM 44229]
MSATPPVAAGLVRLANQALEAGDPSTAAERLVEAADVHGSTDPRGRAVLLSQAAVLFRLADRADDAATAARTAWDTTADVGTRRAAAVELSEVARSSGDPDTAAAWLYRALPSADPVGRARILVKLANLEAAAGRFTAAVRAGEEAAGALEGTGHAGEAVRVRLELGGALLAAGDPARATFVVEQCLAAARARDDAAALAEGHLVAMAIALRRGDDVRAGAAAASARAEALRAGSAVPYLAAAAAQARLAETAGDRVGAYGSLAVAWVTLGDLVGREAGRAMVEPLLLDLRQGWGAGAFDQARSAYEDRRRAAREGRPSR